MFIGECYSAHSHMYHTGNMDGALDLGPYKLAEFNNGANMLRISYKDILLVTFGIANFQPRVLFHGFRCDHFTCLADMPLSPGHHC